jgi:Domain of unknown function (DUF4279)
VSSLGTQRTKLSLHLKHPTRDLSTICRTLGLRPKIIWKEGEERRTPKGRRLAGVRESSYCSIDLGATSKVELSKKIESAVRSLKPHRAILRRLTSTGGRISFYVGWFCDNDTGETLSSEILRQMTDMEIALDLNIYLADA